MPLLVVGAEGKGPAYELDRVYGAVRLPDGGLAIGNSATGELRLYDKNGRFLKAASRGGQGPGEFEVGSAIYPKILRSMIIAGDQTHARVNRYDFAGKVLPQIVLSSSPPAVQSFVVATVGSNIVAQVTASPALQGAPGQRISTHYRYGVYDSTGKQRVALFELPTQERIVHEWEGTLRFPFLPFSPAPIVAASADKVYLIRAGEPTIEIWSLSAKRIGTLTWDAKRPRVRDIWSRWRQAGLDAMTRQNDRLRYQNFLTDRLPLPEYVPVAEAMHVDPAGRIWVVRTPMPWDRNPMCDVIDASGRFLGSVALPPKFTLFQVGADFILGRARDADDVEQVQLLRLIRVGSS
ncbi:MAG: hypothetical protein IT353_18390 [Gemmatimonadaceae bacterium]|nr:hypothetical protein [Gemmatimonadaceae bacterium]